MSGSFSTIGYRLNVNVCNEWACNIILLDAFYPGSLVIIMYVLHSREVKVYCGVYMQIHSEVESSDETSNTWYL